MGGQVIAHRGSYIREPFEQALKFEEIFTAISIDRHFPRFPYGAAFIEIGREEPGFVPRNLMRKICFEYLADGLQASLICIMQRLPVP